jgi:spermidine/putrescine transport system substrate-binding protein
MKKWLVFPLSILMISALVLSGCGPSEQNEMGDVLRVLNWQGYGSDESWALDQFEQLYGVKVEHDYITSEEELLTKMRTSPGVYDVVLPNIAYLKIAMDEGLLDPIDTSKLDNWDSLLDRFKSLESIRQGSDVYGVPWTWGATAMVYNSEVYPDGFDSWNVFWDEQYAGQIGWWDSYEDSTVLVGIELGDPTPYSPDDLDAVQAKMRELMPNVRTLWTSEDEFDKLFANGDINMGVFWSGSAARAKNAMGLPMEFIIPKEGAIGWIDTWAIAKDAPNPEAAYKFIDYMISADFYVKWDTEVGAPTPTSQATLDGLPEDSFNRAVMGNPEVVSRLIWMETVPENERQQWNQIWEEVKAEQ